MPRFARLVPDGSRASGEPAISAANENAKTDLLESLLISTGSDMVSSPNGFHVSNRLAVAPAVLFMVREIAGMGGGRYLGCAYSLANIQWWRTRTENLAREFLGVPPNYNTVEIWCLPELLVNSSGHQLINDVDEGQIGIGLLIHQGPGMPVVLMVDTLPQVARMQVTNPSAGTNVILARITDGVTTSDIEYAVATGRTDHVIGDEILAVRPLGGVRYDVMYSGVLVTWEEIGSTPRKQVTIVTNMRVNYTTRKIQMKTRLATVIDPGDGSDDETDWIDVHTGVTCTPPP